MTEVVEELELFDIVEVVQTRLAKNFTLLLKRINKHEQSIQEQQNSNQNQQQEYQQRIEVLQN